MRRAVSALVVLAFVACSSGPSTSSASGSSSSGSGGASGYGGTGGLGGADAGCYMNGGFACVTSADCPPSDGCDFCFSCDLIPDGTKVCRWHPLDAGFCDPL